MEDQLILFDTSKLAKEKGLTYDEVGQSYRSNGEFTYGRNDEHFYPAPTQSVLQKWLREKKQFYIEIEMDGDLFAYKSHNIINPELKWNKLFNRDSGFKFNSYEAALEAGICDALCFL
jgi:hypothetical protein